MKGLCMWDRVMVWAAVCLCVMSAAALATDGGPVFVMPAPDNEANVVRLPDGTLACVYMVMGERVESIRSADGGRTWSEPRVEFQMNGKRSHHACRVLVDDKGELHLFFVVHATDEEKQQRDRQRALDVWYNCTIGGGATWGEARRIFVGYVGALRGVMQMPTGRIVLAFAVWNGSEPRPRSGPDNTGSHFTTTMHSDDHGDTWQLSSAVLASPTHEGYNGNNYGAVEPTVTMLNDGKAWMLIRTQAGVLYESFSHDGAAWTPAAPTRFYSSNSPAGVERLDDGRLLLMWNNTQMPARLGPKQMLYAGRDTLHAAISDDDGATWRGFREIYRDPMRNQRPPDRGDRGTAYPNAADSGKGEVVVVTGQGENHRAILRFDPNWLLETSREDDFSNGLDGWCVFKEFGEPYRIFRDRKIGPELVAHPDRADAKVLHVRRPDAAAPDAAVWNFPNGVRGELQLRVMLRPGFAGGAVALLDRFFNPNDTAADAEAMFRLPIDARGSLAGMTTLEPDRWYDLHLAWDVVAARCEVSVDGRNVGTLAMQKPTVNGISYLRLASTASEPDAAGFFVERVRAEVAPDAPVASIFELKRMAGPVLAPGEPGKFDARWVTCPTIDHDGATYRMWYSSFFETGTGRGGIGLATSDDGVTWRRHGDGSPLLEPAASGALDAGQVMGPQVLRDGDRYLMWYTGMSEGRHASGFGYYRIFLASSNDGVRWTRENNGEPVVGIGPADAPDAVQAATPSVLRDGDGYRMWYAAWSPSFNHVICAARSRDGVRWEKENNGEPVRGLEPSIAFGQAVTRLGDGYLMLYMALKAGNSLYAAQSDDGIHWRMLNGGEPVLRPGAAGGFDEKYVGHPELRVEGGTLRVWYTGYHAAPDFKPPLGMAIGLAEATLPAGDPLP